MKFFIFFLFSAVTLTAQTTATFEQTNFGAAKFLDNSGTSGVFANGNIALVNNYNTQFQSWDGWALSKDTDITTASFINQFSCIAGKGYNNSAAYAVGYTFESAVIRLTGPAEGKGVQGLYLNNSTYAYLSMRDGDGFAKKFGGPTGNDPDYYFLTIKAMKNGNVGADSVNFYLADYRFANNTQDYLVKDWTFVNLSTLGNADSLLFSVSSSDVGAFGINTPTYFCMDNLTTLDGMVAQFEPKAEAKLSVYPNLVQDVLHIVQEGQLADYQIVDMHGKVVREANSNVTEITVSDLQRGWFLLRSGNEVVRFCKL
jgi:Domain of unknown function (DUF4465)/Secretion system C-terminal sorting domain